MIQFLFQPNALWVGVHYSPDNKRYCINLIPFFTICYVCKGGKPPTKGQA